MSSLPDEAMGPKMLALKDERRQKFAWLMACGELSASEAARQAGYSGHMGTSRATAHHMMHNPAVLEAIQEASRKVLSGLAPLAIRSARAILEDPAHSQHARMIETVLDRTGFFAKTEHKVLVEHSVDVRELEDLARRLAAEAGIAPERLLGVNAPPVIEGTVAHDEAAE